MAPPDRPALLSTYLARRPDLIRFFTARLKSSAAAEDLVQETLIAMHSRRATYEPSQPLTAWVYGIARYKLIDEYRRTRRRASVPLDEAPSILSQWSANPASFTKIMIQM